MFTEQDRELGSHFRRKRGTSIAAAPPAATAASATAHGFDYEAVGFAFLLCHDGFWSRHAARHCLKLISCQRYHHADAI